MVQRREQLGFAFESGQPFGVAGELGGQNLDRHVAVKGGVACSIHLTHTTLPEFGGDLVGAEARAGLEGHSGEVRIIALRGVENGSRCEEKA